MLALPSVVPANAQELKAALTQALARFVIVAASRAPVEIVGEFPAMASVAINLTDATARLPQSVSTATSAGRAVEISTGKLSLVADPLRFGQGAIRLHLDATDVRFALEKSIDGKSGLNVLSAREGHAKLQTTRLDLEVIARSLLSEAAARQGAKIEKVELKLTQTTPRSAELLARVTLKKMFFTAVLKLAGKVAVDDSMNATVSGLSCQGEGAIGSLAASATAPKLAEIDGQSFSLVSATLGNIRMRNMQFMVGETITLEASF